MQHRRMSNGHGLAQCGTKLIRHVNHRAVLEVRTRADHDVIEVCAQNALEPSAGFRRHDHIADECRICSNESILGDFGRGCCVPFNAGFHGEILRA
jgi:hypothetical protein